MRNKYTPSVNIIRDTDNDVFYIPTPNAKKVINQLIDDFRKGVRAFSIIGSYGTGKSSFLLALEQSLKKVKPYFDIKFIQGQHFDSVKIVGSYKSIIDTFAEEFNVRAKTNVTEHIFSEIFNRYHDLGKTAPLLFIIIDEFGKFLEYASQNNPEKELYFVQQLAEFANNTKYNIALITTIHQSFESYAFSLSASQRQEWSKVKGRFREITFNEPVEQLLFLASEHINDSFPEKIATKEIDKTYSLFAKSKAFNYTEQYSKEISNKLYPLDLLAANVLTLSLQRYGQNERSLFSFLESTDHTGIEKFNKSESPFYNLANVYDFLNFNFYSFLSSKYNPDFLSWSSIKTALEEVERNFETNLSVYYKIIKTIGLLNIYAAAGSVMDEEFLVEYAKTCLGFNNAEQLIENLANKKVILYRSYHKRFILFEGTDLDIQTALIEAANKVSEITDVKTILERYYDLPPILAKQYSYKIGTPRYFKFVISEYPINEVPSGEIDGFINLIFNEKLTIRKVKEDSSKQKEAILYGFYRNSKEIKNLLYEIEKAQKVLEDNNDDKVAKRELENIVVHQKNLLNHYILSNLFGGRTEVTWFWDGEEQKLNSKKKFNELLSEISSSVYSSTPIFKNELVNKHKISSAIHTAKKSFFKALVNNWDQYDLGLPLDKFPPEKTIYITLLKENGLITYSDEVKKEVSIANRSTFKKLWKNSVEFLNEAKSERKNLSRLVTQLQHRPFKLKQGLINVWVPVFLFLKRDDYALFGEHGFIPYLNEDILDLISREPHEFYIKTFDIEGVKLDVFNSYRLFLNQEAKEKISNDTFIETIKPFLVFYRQLPVYSKGTKRLSKEAIAIRDAISNSQDPERSFFEDFPTALNTSLKQLKSDSNELYQYIGTLQSAIKELRTSFDKLIDRFEEFIISEIVYEDCDFESYKEKLQSRFKTLKKHFLLPNQKAFINRIDSTIEDKKAWFSSLCQAVIGKSLEVIKDEDELVLYDKFKSMILELDSLTVLSRETIDETKEEILGLQFNSFVDGVKHSLVRLPKGKSEEVNQVMNTLQKALVKDKIINIAALTKLLKELIQQ